MSLDSGKEKCVVCKAYLFAEDDVVYCPECGAPHHRECYNAIGHCALEKFHGTDAQYKKPQAEPEKVQQETPQDDYITCGMCGEKYDKQEIACPNCNKPNIARASARFIAFDFLGGVPADTDLGNGVTANEAKQFVSSNTHRYIPKFFKFSKGKKFSWNWFAFLVPSAWFLSRKMYLLGILIGAMQIAISMLSVPMLVAVQPLYESVGYDFVALSNLIADNVSNIGVIAITVAFVGSSLDIILRFVSALFGDVIYKNHVITKVCQIKRESEEVEFDLLSKGGVSLIAAMLGHLAVYYLPSIIASTLGLM